MRRTYIGEFEELVLLVVAVLQEEAYGVSVKQTIFEQTGRNVNISAVHSALKRMEAKGLLTSEMGKSEARRGGRRKRLYQVTVKGQRIMSEVRESREKLWSQIPKISLG